MLPTVQEKTGEPESTESTQTAQKEAQLNSCNDEVYSPFGGRKPRIARCLPARSAFAEQQQHCLLASKWHTLWTNWPFSCLVVDDGRNDRIAARRTAIVPLGAGHRRPGFSPNREIVEMGSRASYVVKRDGQARAYGSHWGASSLMDDLFWGPDYATRAFEAQEELKDLEEIEGGDDGCALIDWDERRLIWYFANCELPVQQQLYNRMLAETWPEWTIDLATREVDDLLDYLGIASDEPTDDDDEDDDEDPEYEDEDEDEDADQGTSCESDDDLVYQPEPITGPIRDIEEDLEPGDWLTIREKDGTCRDYFGFPDELADFLTFGEALIEELEEFTTLDSPPHELITLDGAVIDRREKVIWRWQGPRYPWDEDELREAWEGWSLKDLPGGWQAQLDATGREAGELAGGHREILGLTVAGLLNDSSKDPREALAKLAAIGHGVRRGCAGITLTVAVVGIGLSMWLDSTAMAIVAGILFVICLLLTSWLWRKTTLALCVLDSVNSSPKDAPVPDGLNIEQKREILDGVLDRLGYPSIEQLEADGELPNDEEDEEACYGSYDDEDEDCDDEEDEGEEEDDDDDEE